MYLNSCEMYGHSHSQNARNSSRIGITAFEMVVPISRSRSMVGPIPPFAATNAAPSAVTPRTISPIGDASAPISVASPPSISSNGPTAAATPAMASPMVIIFGSSSISFPANSVIF